MGVTRVPASQDHGDSYVNYIFKALSTVPACQKCHISNWDPKIDSGGVWSEPRAVAWAPAFLSSALAVLDDLEQVLSPLWLGS